MKKVNVNLRLNDDENALFDKALKAAGLRKRDVTSWRIAKKSVDARHKNDIKIVYTIDVYTGDEPQKPSYKRVNAKSVIIVGAGPAGLTAALDLTRHGVKVEVFERGQSVERREMTVKAFLNGGELDENTNVQFGEGGAGAFSDGKLNTGVNSTEIKYVLEDLVSFGAPEDILYLSKPHIGSDRLPEVVKNMREEIIRLGGSFRFCEKVNSLVVKNGAVSGVVTDKGEYHADKVVLAIGHSSRDTFSYLFKAGFAIESKEFAVGFRIEQLQEVINKDRYGEHYNDKKLPVADYKLVSHASERAVFTFCMCPGGVVLPSASERGMLVVNGMSNYARSGKNANSAVVCQVKKDDFGSSPMAGIDFQRSMERLAFEAAGDYIAPVQLAEDFVADRPSSRINGVLPTYSRGYEFFELKKLFPKSITDALRAGLYDMDGKIKGFASDGAILTGVETRTSSPIRIPRKDNFECVSHKNLYPCGEGCGYAGGIMSACVDGVKVSRAIVGAFINENS